MRIVFLFLNIFFSAVTTESNPPSISWYKEDEELIESNRYRFSAEEDGTYLLNIVPLEINDQAEWKCVAVNKYGQTVTSSFLKLNVPKNFKPPRFLEELRIAFSNEGSVNLECKVRVTPNLGKIVHPIVYHTWQWWRRYGRSPIRSSPSSWFEIITWPIVDIWRPGSSFTFVRDKVSSFQRVRSFSTRGSLNTIIPILFFKFIFPLNSLLINV